MGDFQILSWNVRGLNKRDKQRSMSLFCKKNKVGLAAFLETKTKDLKLEEMMKTYFEDWAYHKGNESEGRILVLWKRKRINVDIIQEK